MPDIQDEVHPGQAHWDQRPALGRRGMVLMAGVVVVIAAAAFGIVSLVSQGSDTQASAIRVPTSGWISGQEEGTETIRGTLSVDERHCVYLETGTGEKVFPVWPAGFYGRLDGAGNVRLYDGADELVARDGAALQASGTFQSAAQYAGEPCLPGEGDVAVVQSEVTVLP
ncbi:hypothetical protein [Nocardioides sp. YIM 152315]|uniref:hypothetical protein n=1 Tax=Nocardioides sp. YIM 152315 TaxID=3031760 RepID=UPI0023DB1CB4|nr:hypothetical protein [Nocardioides sp. YIM 152315]MDF1602324.1 hypothetical protein [Nocardioides sp. YIM 152315]